MSSAKPDYYRFVQCPEAECGLRFPGVVGVACPLCKTETALVSDRAQTPSEAIALAPVLPLSFLLDNIRSVFNVGSIFRTADGCGASHLYLGGITPTPDHSAMRKTALGAEKRLPWSSHRNGPILAAELVSSGKRLWALEYTTQSVDIFHLTDGRPSTEIVLVVGNEVTGVDPGILAHCERTLHIPMHGEKASLNVATAIGIAGYALSTSQAA